MLPQTLDSRLCQSLQIRISLSYTSYHSFNFPSKNTNLRDLSNTSPLQSDCNHGEEFDSLFTEGKIEQLLSLENQSNKRYQSQIMVKLNSFNKCPSQPSMTTINHRSHHKISHLSTQCTSLDLCHIIDYKLLYEFGFLSVTTCSDLFMLPHTFRLDLCQSLQIHISPCYTSYHSFGFYQRILIFGTSAIVVLFNMIATTRENLALFSQRQVMEARLFITEVNH